MTREEWRGIRAILESALEMDAPNRAAFLDSVCEADSIRREIESLIEAHDQANDAILTGDALRDFSATETENLSLRAGTRIGRYEVVDRIAEGGMGAVYRAIRADGQYKQKVAIKLVRLDSGGFVSTRRFRNEQQILASLDHPNIAKILDGGATPDGRAYFVMELVDGSPITEYCEKNKLTIDARLHIFRAVCSAVHYAHQRLVIHRDIKPTNILVRSDSVPKLLDFGIAKIHNLNLLADNSTETIAGQWLMTPEYASPEQLRGETITTAADVYCLGVVLYQLLTGEQPYRFPSRTPHEIARVVLETHPERPSKLRKQLSGDLEKIIQKAMRKEPRERYNSADQLSEDIRRHQEGLPVYARPDTLRYRVSKFVSRHRGGVATAVLATIAVFAGLGVALYEAHLASVQQTRAEARFNDLRTLANSLMFDVHDSIQDLPGSTPARKLLVERALRYLDSLSRDAASDISLQRELATAYEKVGTVQGNPFGANLGDLAGALSSYKKSLAIRQRLAVSNEVQDLVDLAKAQRLTAGALANLSVGRNDNANMTAELRALSTAERAFELAPSDPGAIKELLANYDLLITITHYTGNFERAWSYLQKELPIAAARADAASNDRNALFLLGKTEVKAGQELAALGWRTEGSRHSKRAIQIFEGMSAGGTDANAARHLAWAHDRFGDTLLMDGNVAGAIQNYRNEIRILQPLVNRDAANAVLELDLATSLTKLGNAMATSGDPKAGLVLLQRGMAMLRQQIARDPSYSEPVWSLQWAMIWAGQAQMAGGQAERAVETFKKVLAQWETSGAPLIQTFVAGVRAKMASALATLGRRDESREELRRALASAQQLIQSHPYMTDAEYVIADATFELGRISSPGASEAQVWYNRSREAWAKINNPGNTTPFGLACGSPKKVAAELSK